MTRGTLALGSLVLAVVVLTPAWAAAGPKTWVYLKNDTPHAVRVILAQTGGLDNDGARIVKENMNPGERAKVLWLSRDGGIKSGTTYELATWVDVGQVSKRVILRQRLKGQVVGSHMWQSVALHDLGSGAPDQLSPWYDDRTTRTVSFPQDGVPFTVSYRAIATAGYDDLEYVLRHAPPPKPVVAKVQPKNREMIELQDLRQTVNVRAVFGLYPYGYVDAMVPGSYFLGALQHPERLAKFSPALGKLPKETCVQAMYLGAKSFKFTHKPHGLPPAFESAEWTAAWNLGNVVAEGQSGPVYLPVYCGVLPAKNPGPLKRGAVFEATIVSADRFNARYGLKGAAAKPKGAIVRLQYLGPWLIAIENQM